MSHEDRIERAILFQTIRDKMAAQHTDPRPPKRSLNMAAHKLPNWEPRTFRP